MTARITCPVDEHAVKDGDRIALISNSRSLTYRQLNDAIHLKHFDVKPRERVAIISANTVDHIIALFALWRQGAVACLLSTRLPQEGIRTCLQNISCAKSVTGTNFQESSSIKKLVPVTDLNALADIMFTSGTSDEPKAVAHSFGNHYASALAANEHIPVLPGDRWLLSLPLYHVGGLGIVWRTFLAGGTVAVPDPSADLADSLRKFNITHVSLVPTQLRRLLSDPKNLAVLQKMKAILIGGSAIPDALLRKAIDASLPVHVTYGLTEMSSQVATSKRLTREDPLSRGQILRCAQVKISDTHEILVKGKTLFLGYVKGEGIEPALDQEGWFHTGDLGCLNEDGTLTVLGRKDNMFISGGENIQPEEIERHLCHIEGIVQAVVVPVRSEEFGSRPVAFVEMKEGTRLSKEEILSSLQEYLPSFKLPDQIYPWPKVERGLKLNRLYFLRLIDRLSSRHALEVKDEDLANIISLFNIVKKNDLLKHAKDIVIEKHVFANIIFAAELGLLSYGHRIFYKDYIPEHLHPTDEERAALHKNGVGELKGDARKFIRKVSQIFKDRKYLVGHLFYLPDLSKWHFFYFNQRDWDGKANHWEYGSHVHFINYLWNLDVQKLWEGFVRNGEIPGGAIHIRFKSPEV